METAGNTVNEIAPAARSARRKGLTEVRPDGDGVTYPGSDVCCERGLQRVGRRAAEKRGAEGCLFL